MYRLVILLVFAVFAVSEAMPNTKGRRKSHHPRVVGKQSGNCTGGDVECLSGEYQGHCIPFHWICDNWNDCGDASDEDLSLCPAVSCSSPDIKCPTTNVCITPDWKCDEWDDCGDNWDEMQNCQSGTSDSGDSGSSDCRSTVNKALMKQARNKKLPTSLAKAACSGNEVACPAGSPDAGECIPDNWFCDEWNDCGDASDESTQAPANCNPVVCDACDFTCESTNMCIPSNWICDGDNDCGDRSDEQICPECSSTVNKALVKEALNKKRPTRLAKAACSGNDVECPAGSPHAGECIPDYWFCDEWNDCGDASDESTQAPSNCQAAVCDAGCEFTCGSTNMCIPTNWICDGDNDCGDFSDEQNCPVRKSKAHKLWSFRKATHKG